MLNSPNTFLYFWYPYSWYCSLGPFNYKDLYIFWLLNKCCFLYWLAFIDYWDLYISCFFFSLKNTHTARLIPLITGGVSSRSKEIRRCSCEFLNQILQTWDTHHFEKHIQLIQTCLKKGMADADQDARNFSRKYACTK